MRLHILISIIKGWLRILGQKLISYYLLFRANIKYPLRVDFPFNIRGKARNISLGRNARLGKNIFINCRGMLFAESNCHFHNNSIVFVGNRAEIKIGKNFTLGATSVLKSKNNKWHLGSNASISTNCAIFARENDTEGRFELGNNSNVSDYTIIDVCNDVIIGNEVAIGSNCTIFTHNHIYTDKTKASWKGGIITAPVKINDGAWVGANVTIMPGVTIGKRAVVASGSVVTKDIPEETVVGGVPSKIIKPIE